MKKIKIFYILTFIVLIGNISCDNYVEDLNKDPNGITDSDAKNLFQGILLSNQFWQNSSTARLNMIWLNQATGADRQYVGLNDWNNVTAGDFTNDWSVIYSNTMANAKLIEEKAIVENKIYMAGVAKLIRAYALGMAASFWGDIPASEALNVEQFPNPSYDSQQDVYNFAQNLLDEALVLLNTPSTVSLPSDLDIVYGGDVSKWIKLAHSTKARFYLHVKDYTNANVEAGLGISNPSEDYKSKFGTTYGGSFNPYYSFLVYDRDGYMSAADAYLPNLIDPAGANYRGNSKTDETLRFNFDYITYQIYNSGYELNFLSLSDWNYPEGRFGTESPMPLMTYGEMLLIKAEYETRVNGLTAGISAYNQYRALLRTGYSIGINNDGYAGLFGGNFASGMYLDYNASDFSSGGIENSDNINDVDALLREIYEERYVYFIGNLESFNDFRRTNNIAEIQLKSGFSGSPQRFLYPQSEVNSNSNIPSPLPDVTTKTPINL